MFGWFKRIFKGEPHKRGYHDLMASRLQSDWYLSGDDPNQRLRQTFTQLREMSRDLAETNHYAVTYLKAVQVNVVGPEGIKLQSQVTTEDGAKDEAAVEVVEANWKEWQQPENCTVNGCDHFTDVDRLMERTLAADGELFLWVFIGHDVNSHQFSIRPLESDHIDHELNVAKLDNGNRITMGVETTTSGRVVAYWVDTVHPGSMYISGRKRLRVEALSEWMGETINPPSARGYILHQFETKRAGQMRGVPDLAAVMSPLRDLERTESAHHGQARASAYAVFQKVSTVGDEGGQGQEDKAAGRENLKPLSVLTPDLGFKYEVMQPAAPNSNMPDHGKYTLKGAGAALGLAYPGFSGDLEGTSFSSGRTGASIERDNWKVKQNSTVNCRHRPIFNAHLRAQLVFGLLRGYGSTRDEMRLRAARWQARGWGFINPLQDINALAVALELQVTSPQRAIRDRGDDPEEVLREIAEWKESVKMALGEPESEAGEEGVSHDNSDADRAINAALAVQKLYLGVGIVISPEEAREIVNAAGGKLPAAVPDSVGSLSAAATNDGQDEDNRAFLKVIDSPPLSNGAQMQEIANR